MVPKLHHLPRKRTYQLREIEYEQYNKHTED